MDREKDILQVSVLGSTNIQQSQQETNKMKNYPIDQPDDVISQSSGSKLPNPFLFCGVPNIN